MFKKIILGLYLAIILSITMFLFYYLPTARKVHLVGTQVKREIKTNNKAGKSIVDIRYVVARSIPEGESLTFRNEDNIWPPYFKVNSGGLSGDAMNLAKNDSQTTILLEYYGFRIPLLSMFPNVTSLSKVDKSYKYTPWLSITVYVIFGVFALWNLIKLIRFLYFRKKKESKLDSKKPLQSDLDENLN